MTAALPVLIVVVPLMAAILVALLGRAWRGFAWPATVLATGFSLAGAVQLLVAAAGGQRIVYALGGWAAPTGIEYVVDRLNGIVLVMVSAVGFLVALWMRKSVERELRAAARNSFYAIVLLNIAGLLGMAVTGDVFNLYVFLEITSITSYVIVAMGRRRQALFASFTYLILGSIGATFILIGIGHLYQATGTLQMAELPGLLADASATRPAVVHTAFAFIAAGLALKMALFPLHAWQPGAYTQAPSAGSFLLAATATKVAAYAFYRMAFGVFGADYVRHALPGIMEVLLIMAATAMIVGPLMAVPQGNLKRMLAYSSVGQIGYILLGALLLQEDAITGSLVHFWNHAASKGALFGVAGALFYATGAARIDDLRGLARRAPWTATAMTLAALSLVGVPLTGGFVTKYYLAIGSLEAGRPVLLAIILISSLLTAVYMWRCLQRVWFAPADVTPAVEQEVPWSMRLPTLALALACIALGVWASFPTGLAAAAARVLLGSH